MFLFYFQRKIEYKETLALLLVLYFIQGVNFGYIMSADLIFQKNGTTMKDQATLSFAHYPYFTKMFFAPLLDFCFSEKFGRRKTYIVPTLILLGIVFTIFSLFVENFLVSLKVIPFTIFAVGATFLLSINDISVDALGNSFLQNNSLKHASTTEFIGSLVGQIFGYNLFTLLNSPDFVNQYIYTLSSDSPVITSAQLLQFLAVLSFILVIYLVFFVKEPVLIAKELQSVKESYSLYLSFWKNKNLRHLIVWLFFLFWGQMTIVSTFDFMMVSRGYLRSTIAMIHFLYQIAQIIACIILGKYLKNGLYLKSICLIAIIQAIGLSLKLIPYTLFDAENPSDDNYKMVTIMLFVSSICEGSFKQYYFIHGAWVSENAETSLASSFKTGLYGISNFSEFFSNTMALRFASCCNYYYFTCIGLISQIVYALVTFRTAKKLDEIPKEGFSMREGFENVANGKVSGDPLEKEKFELNENEIEDENKKQKIIKKISKDEAVNNIVKYELKDDIEIT